jgi:hypothetical protein
MYIIYTYIYIYVVCLPESKWCPKSKVKVKLKTSSVNLRSVGRCVSLAEVGLCDGERIQHPQHSTELCASKHLWCFLSGGFLGTICLQIPRDHCTANNHNMSIVIQMAPRNPSFNSRGCETRAQLLVLLFLSYG